MREECLECLQSSIGMCNLHQPKYEMVSSTSTNFELTRTEKFNEIIRWACKLVSFKWYQFNKRNHCIKMIKHWENELRQQTK